MLIAGHTRHGDLSWEIYRVSFWFAGHIYQHSLSSPLFAYIVTDITMRAIASRASRYMPRLKWGHASLQDSDERRGDAHFIDLPGFFHRRRNDASIIASGLKQLCALPRGCELPRGKMRPSTSRRVATRITASEGQGPPILISDCHIAWA